MYIRTCTYVHVLSSGAQLVESITPRMHMAWVQIPPEVQLFLCRKSRLRSYAVRIMLLCISKCVSIHAVCVHVCFYVSSLRKCLCVCCFGMDVLWSV